MNRYFDEMVLSASPMGLIRLLYQKAIASTEAAREHLKAGRIAARSQAINQAYVILAELTVTLRPESAPELGGRLSALYSYMQARLLHANLRQDDAPLAEVLGLLAMLSESWEAVSDSWEQVSDAGSAIAMTA
jgi:flagellar protein FliS